MITLGNILYIRDENNAFIPVMGASGGSGGLTTEQINALDGMFTLASYSSNPIDAYATFRTAFNLGSKYNVTLVLSGCDCNNSTILVAEGEAYNATLTAQEGYTLDGATINITMDGVDITSDVYEGGVITIDAVTGDVIINVSCAEAGAVDNLAAENILMSDTKELVVGLDVLDGLEKVYLYGTTGNEYHKKVGIKARYTSAWGYEWIANGVTIATANAGTDSVVTAGYDHYDDGGYIVFEIDVPALLAARQSLLDSGTLDATKDGNFGMGLTIRVSGSTQYLLKSYVD